MAGHGRAQRLREFQCDFPIGRRHERIIHIDSRRQGLMVPTGNPRSIQSVADLTQPGLRFKLDFIPLVTERYFLLCPQHQLPSPPLQAILKILTDPEFHALIDAIPGYSPQQCGTIETLQQAFPNARFTSAQP